MFDRSLIGAYAPAPLLEDRMLRTFRSIRRLAWLLPLLAGTAGTSQITGCSDVTGDKCKKGCPCGAACISCSETCHKDAAYAITGIVPDSLLPR